MALRHRTLSRPRGCREPLPVTTIRASPAPTGAPRGPARDAPNLRRRLHQRPTAMPSTPLGVPDPTGIGAQVLRNGCPSAPESVPRWSRNPRSGHVGTGAQVRPEYASGCTIAERVRPARHSRPWVSCPPVSSVVRVSCSRRERIAAHVGSRVLSLAAANRVSYIPSEMDRP